MATQKIPKKQAKTLRLKIFLALAILWWERLLVAFWPALCMAGLFISAALFDVLYVFGSLSHVLMTLGFTAAILYTAGQGWQRFEAPGRYHAMRLLETGGHLTHRPLTSKDDRLVNPDEGETATLWASHKQHQASLLKQLRLRWPFADMARHDPYALRIIVILLVASGFVIAQDQWKTRLTHALTAQIAEQLQIGNKVKLNAWITPPEYTQAAPVFLDQVKISSETQKVPRGSILTVNVTGQKRMPQMTLKDQTVDFKAVDNTAFRLEYNLQESGLITVWNGIRRLSQWNIEIRPDTPPEIELTSPPTQEKSSLKLSYKARDDYGIKSIKAIVLPPDSAEIKPVELDLPVNRQSDGNIEASSYQDLSAHPMAGLEGILFLETEDVIGQKSRTEEYPVTLPEKEFTHPVARRIARLRAHLLQNTQPDKTMIYEGLKNIMFQPGEFHGDIVVFMAVRSAASRLMYDQDQSETQSTAQLLWDTALRLEDGDIALRARDLEVAQEKLMDALGREDITDAEIQELMQNFKQAMNNYMESVGRELRDRISRGEDIMVVPEEFLSNAIGTDDFIDFMTKLEQVLNSGSRQAAQEMLSEFQKMMQDIQFGQSDGPSQELQQAMKTVEDLNEIIKKQQDLLRETEEISPRPSQSFGEQLPHPKDSTLPKNSLPPPPEMTEPTEETAKNRKNTAAQCNRLAAGQQGIRMNLGKIMRSVGELMGDIPENFGKAERLMRKAQEKLTETEPFKSAAYQKLALEQLQKSKEEYSKQLMQALKNMVGMGIGASGERDPLGRKQNRSWVSPHSDVKIPGESELRRVQRILEELRRRSNDSDRPAVEKDYLQRLLKRF